MSASGSMPKIKEEWKNRVWRRATATQLMISDVEMIQLQCYGSEPCSVMVHKALLCFYSPYHKRLLSGTSMASNRTQSNARSLTISASSRVLKLFFTWLYTGELGAPFPRSKQISTAEECCVFDLYILAYFFNCIALQRCIMSVLQKANRDSNHVVNVKALKKIARTALEPSALYRFAVDNWAYHFATELDQPPECPPGSFAYHVLSRMGEKGFSRENCSCCNVTCAYHNHESEEERKATCEVSDEMFQDIEESEESDDE